MDTEISVSKKGEKRRGPKARGPFEGKRVSLSTRITTETSDKLKAAAIASGRSVAQEAELRLDRTFEEEAAAGGRDIYSLQELIGLALRNIEADTGNSFAQDWPTFRKAMAAVETIIKAMRPDMAPELKSWFEDVGDDPGPEPAEPAPPRGSFLGNTDNVLPEDLAAHEKAKKDHESDTRIWALKVYGQRQRLKERFGFDRDLAEAGRDAAARALAELFFPKRKGED